MTPYELQLFVLALKHKICIEKANFCNSCVNILHNNANILNSICNDESYQAHLTLVTNIYNLGSKYYNSPESFSQWSGQRDVSVEISF